MFEGSIFVERIEIDDKIVSIEKNFREICVKIKKRGREILSDYDITPPQFTALLILLYSDELTIGELSKKMYLACSTVTDLIDRMEKNELVKRVRDTNDRRIVRVKVLEKGHQVLDQVLYTRRRYISEVFSSFSDEKIELLNESFEILNRSFEVTGVKK